MVLLRGMQVMQSFKNNTDGLISATMAITVLMYQQFVNNKANSYIENMLNNSSQWFLQIQFHLK